MKLRGTVTKIENGGDVLRVSIKCEPIFVGMDNPYEFATLDLTPNRSTERALYVGRRVRIAVTPLPKHALV